MAKDSPLLLVTLTACSKQSARLCAAGAVNGLWHERPSSALAFAWRLENADGVARRRETMKSRNSGPRRRLGLEAESA